MPYLTHKQAENLQSIALSRFDEVPSVGEMANVAMGENSIIRDSARHKGTTDALKHLAPIIDPSDMTPDESRDHWDMLDGVFEVDLDDCTPEYAAAYREAWLTVYQLLKGDADNA